MTSELPLLKFGAGLFYVVGLSYAASLTSTCRCQPLPCLQTLSDSSRREVNLPQLRTSVPRRVWVERGLS